MEATLAIACGPIVTTWDVSKCNEVTVGSNYIVAEYSVGEGIGVKQCRPHGNSTISDLGLSHNGQVLATCSTSSCTTDNDDRNNVALTLADSMTTLESFSNFHTSSKPTSDHQRQSSSSSPITPPYFTDTSPATSISFGGSIARSRYLVVSDAGGAVSVWDMKKNSRSRCFRIPPSSTTSKPITIHDTTHDTAACCSKACMDPTDMFVAALSSGCRQSSTVRLDLFSLRDKKTAGKPYVTMLEDGCESGIMYGGAECFHFSSIVTNRVMVGARNGTLLLWDIATPSPTLTTILSQAHTGTITDLSFSPVNSVLVASCSTDRTIAFHDINSNKSVQVIHPPSSNRNDTPTSSGGQSSFGLSSLAFKSDGLNLAVGSECGLVYLYDLRQTSAGPLSTMDVRVEGHASSGGVRKLQFMPVSAGSASSSSASKGASSSSASKGAVDTSARRTQLVTTATRQSAERELPPVGQMEPTDRNSATATTFTSPLTSVDVQSSMKDLSQPHVHHPSSMDTGDSAQYSLPSPGASAVVRDLFVTKDGTVATPAPKYSSILKKNSTGDSTHALTDTSCHNRPVIVEEPRIDSGAYDSSCVVSNDPSLIHQDRQEQHETFVPVHTDSRISRDGRANDYDEPDSNTRLGENMDAVYERIWSQEILSGDVGGMETDELPTLPTKLSSSASVTIDKNELREMMEDSVDALREDFRESIQNVHRDFLRQSQRQSEEMAAMFEDQRVQIEELLKDNIALRIENENNRRLF